MRLQLRFCEGPDRALIVLCCVVRCRELLLASDPAGKKGSLGPAFPTIHPLENTKEMF